MPLNGCGHGRGNNNIENLKKFMKTICDFNPCYRKYDVQTQKLVLVYYDNIHNGCKVTIDLKSSTITIKVFIHSDTSEVAEHTFHSSGFKECVIPFLTPAELEQQKRFDELELEQQRLMAEQRELEKQEKKSRKEALKKAHLTVPKTCGGVDECELCKTNKAHTLLAWGWTSRSPTFTGT